MSRLSRTTITAATAAAVAVTTALASPGLAQGGLLTASIDLRATTTLDGVTPVGKVTVSNPGGGSPTTTVAWPISAQVDKVNLPDGVDVQLWVERRTSTDPAVAPIPTYVASITLSRQRGSVSASFQNGNIAPAAYEIRLADGSLILYGQPASNSNRPA